MWKTTANTGRKRQNAKQTKCNFDHFRSGHLSLTQGFQCGNNSSLISTTPKHPARVCHPYLVDMGCRGPTTGFKRGQSWYHPTPLGFQPVRICIYMYMYIYICICMYIYILCIHTYNICIQWNMYITHLSINLSVCLPIYLPYLCVCLPIYLTIYLSDCLSTYESIYLNFINTCLSSRHFLSIYLPMEYAYLIRLCCLGSQLWSCFLTVPPWKPDKKTGAAETINIQWTSTASTAVQQWTNNTVFRYLYYF